MAPFLFKASNLSWCWVGFFDLEYKKVLALFQGYLDQKYQTRPLAQVACTHYRVCQCGHLSHSITTDILREHFARKPGAPGGGQGPCKCPFSRHQSTTPLVLFNAHQPPNGVGAFLILTLQVRTLSFREVKSPVEGHPALKWRSQDLESRPHLLFSCAACSEPHCRTTSHTVTDCQHWMDPTQTPHSVH